jgi:tRNA threonylcarbamoyladenosine biosynthesis protein TsaB
VTLVGIDTSMAGASVAVIAGEREIELRDDPAPGQGPRHAAALQPLLEQALEQAGAGWGDVTRICVGVGPGGFTGLRVGIATARALAQSHDLEIVGVSSLEALARGVELAGEPHDPDVPVLALIDARRGEVFAAIYDARGELMEPVAIAPDALAARLESEHATLLGVGDGAVRFRSELERAGVTVPFDGSRAHRVSALMVCRLGRVKEPVDRHALLPDYRREPDAVPPQLNDRG